MTEKIIIRSYSKAIFLLPTLIMSIVGWIIQVIFHRPLLWLELTWILIFLANMFVVCFDFSSSKFIILTLFLSLVAVIFYFTAVPLIFNPNWFKGDFQLLFGFTSHFFIIMTGILIFYMSIAFTVAFFDYYIIERNELLHRKGIFTMVERWTLTNLRFTKEIPDMFEFIMFRAGTLKFYPTRSDIIILPTVLNINKKADQLDRLMSRIKVDATEE